MEGETLRLPLSTVTPPINSLAQYCPPKCLRMPLAAVRVLNVKGKSFNNTESSYKKFTLMQNIPTIVGLISGRIYFTKTSGLI